MALAKALEAEAAQRWIESHVLCESALEESPEHPDALNLMARLCSRAGDHARAIALQSFVLHLRPDHPRAAADLAAARQSIVSEPEGRELYERALAAAPEIACHHRHPYSLLPLAGMDRVEELLRACLALDPSNANAHAALGNVLARRLRPVEAAIAYGLAVMLRWTFAEAHLALADLLDLAGETEIARRHRTAAIQLQQLYAACGTPDEGQRSALVLAANGGSIENAPLDLAVNPSQTALHRFYLTDPLPPMNELPAYDVVFNGIEELEASAHAIELAERFIALAGKPAINDPRNLARINRARLPRTLAAITRCEIPLTVRLDRDALAAGPSNVPAIAGIRFPLLIRPVDTHRGSGLALVSTSGDTSAYLANQSAPAFYVSRFHDFRSPDGYFRKYRTIVVDGRPYPYHLAISDRWMVHYAGSLMTEHAWMREEEERFLQDPSSVARDWAATFSAVAVAVGLDYFGIDYAIAPDGRFLIFECGAAMVVHCREDVDLFAYKYEYVPRIFGAIERMIDARIA